MSNRIWTVTIRTATEDRKVSVGPYDTAEQAKAEIERQQALNVRQEGDIVAVFPASRESVARGRSLLASSPGLSIHPNIDLLA
jgi:hypothetical protein